MIPDRARDVAIDVLGNHGWRLVEVKFDYIPCEARYEINGRFIRLTLGWHVLDADKEILTDIVGRLADFVDGHVRDYSRDTVDWLTTHAPWEAPA